MALSADTKTRLSAGGFGALCGGAGVGILSPGFKDAGLAEVNRVLHLQMELDPPQWAAWVLIPIGIMFLLLAFVGQERIFNRHGATVGTFLAIKHLGFKPAVRDIRRDELPAKFSRRDLRYLTIDLASDLATAPPRLEMAIEQQLRMPADISALLGVNPGVDLAYCGIVQAPFQFLAGYQLSSWARIRNFEWQRHDQCWTVLQEGAGPDLGVSTQTVAVGPGPDMGIAIEVSYDIAAAEIVASVVTIGNLMRVRVAAPLLDCVSHEEQVGEIARQFRAVLDAGRALPAGARIHVFCSAPVSVGFALGRMVSRTLHPPVCVYAYDRAAAKPYPWGVEINGTPGTGQIVRN